MFDRRNSTLVCDSCTKEFPYSQSAQFSYYKDNQGNHVVVGHPHPVCSEQCRQELIGSGKIFKNLMLNEEGVFGTYLIPKGMMSDPFTNPEAWGNSSNETQRKNWSIVSDWLLSGDQSKGFLFYGTPGTGKTCLASLIAKQFRLNEKTIRFTNGFALTQAARDLSKPWSKTEELKAFTKTYAMVDLLLIDEIIGMNFEDPILINLFIQRHAEQKPTIITTNLTLIELKKRLPVHIFSRIMDACTPLGFVFDDQRGKK
jgi:hypothetical protein